MNIQRKNSAYNFPMQSEREQTLVALQENKKLPPGPSSFFFTAPASVLSLTALMLRLS